MQFHSESGAGDSERRYGSAGHTAVDVHVITTTTALRDGPNRSGIDPDHENAAADVPDGNVGSHKTVKRIASRGVVARHTGNRKAEPCGRPTVVREARPAVRPLHRQDEIKSVRRKDSI